MRKMVTIVTAAMAVVLINSKAKAAFHLWQVVEAYSSLDGTLQFVELHNNNDFENFISGHTVIAHGGGPDRVYSFTSNLPTTSTAGRSLLLATPNFQSVTGIAPDFELAGPNFLTVGPGSVEFDGSGSILAHAGFDGANSWSQGGISTTPSPQNFNGDTGGIPEPGMLGLFGLGTLTLRRRSR